MVTSSGRLLFKLNFVFEHGTTVVFQQASHLETENPNEKNGYGKGVFMSLLESSRVPLPILKSWYW